MRNPGGYVTIVSPDRQRVNFGYYCQEIPAGTFEGDSYSCGHCGRVVHIRPKQYPAGTCKQCMKFECPQCVDKGCKPLEKWIERQEAKTRAIKEWF